MAYSIEVVKKFQQAITRWSGGTTTQIAIYPDHAKYSERNFIWRLSSAKVNDEQSTFTPLPGISRVLMVLEGKIQLVHHGHHSVRLKPFKQDYFYGDWATESFGKATDFNLMMTENCQGELTAVSLSGGDSIQIMERMAGVKDNRVTTVLYCVDGDVQMLDNAQNSYKLQAGDALLLHRKSYNQKMLLQMTNIEEKKIHVVRADMQY